MMLRKFGFKKAEPKESEARLKLQKELFAYNRVRVHRAGLGGKQYGRGGDEVDGGYILPHPDIL